MSFNHSLASSVSFDDIKKMGFVETVDGTNDPRGTSYDLKNNKFFITIDAWFEVQLCRLNPDTDFIKIQVDDKFDLEQLVDFISESESEDKSKNIHPLEFENHLKII